MGEAMINSLRRWSEREATHPGPEFPLLRFNGWFWSHVDLRSTRILLVQITQLTLEQMDNLRSYVASHASECPWGAQVTYQRELPVLGARYELHLLMVENKETPEWSHNLKSWLDDKELLTFTLWADLEQQIRSPTDQEFFQERCSDVLTNTTYYTDRGYQRLDQDWIGAL